MKQVRVKLNSRTVAAGVLLLTAMAATVIVMFRRERRWQGRSLSDWVDDFAPGRPLTIREEARKAIQAIGTNAVPALLHWMRAPMEEASWKQKIRYWMYKILFLQGKFVQSWSLAQKSSFGFEALGEAGQAAVPELAAMLSDERRSDSVAGALAGIGKPAVPAALAALQHSDDKVQSLGAKILGAIGASPELAVPALLAEAGHTNRNVRPTAIRSLNGFETNASSALPALTGFLHSSGTELDAAFALAGMGYEGVLTLFGATASTNRPTRVGALGALRYADAVRQVDKTDAMRLQVLEGKQILFNTTALRMALLMYSADTSNAFDSVFAPYIASPDDRTRSAASNAMNLLRQTTRPRTNRFLPLTVQRGDEK